jgi:protein-serine/threonine kinase
LSTLNSFILVTARTYLHWAHDTSWWPHPLPIGNILTQLLADYEQQRIHLMRKHDIDLEDNSLGDGSRTKRLDRKDFDALMGGDGQRGGIFTWREKNRRKVRAIIDLSRSFHASVGVLGVGTISDSACLLLTRRYSCGTNSYSGHFCEPE